MSMLMMSAQKYILKLTSPKMFLGGQGNRTKIERFNLQVISRENIE